MYLSYYYSVLAQRFCFLYTSSDTAGGHPGQVQSSGRERLVLFLQFWEKLLN